MSKHEEYIERLDRIERDLQWIIQYLLKKDQPISPPPYNPIYPGIGTASTNCAKCGMSFDGVTGYVCYQQDCPKFLRVTCQKRIYIMKIEWAENPLETKVFLDDRDRQMLLLSVQNDEYCDILCGIDLWLNGQIEKENIPTIDKIHNRIKLWGDICNLEVDCEEVKYLEDSLQYSHVGDCTCVPASCEKCRAEHALGIDTIKGLGKHPGAKLQGLFGGYGDKPRRTIDEVLEELSKPCEYKKPDNWPDKVGYEKHIPRWENEKKHAYEWLKKYKEDKGF